MEESRAFDLEAFAQRLRELIAPEKPTAFAERAGVKQPTLFKYLRPPANLSPSLDIVAKLAEAGGCSIDWLVWARGEGPEAATGFVKIPRFAGTLAAGAGSWNEGRRQLDYIPFTSEFLRKRFGRTSANGLSILEARGDSMEATIADGGLLLIDETDRRIVDGIFAFTLDGDARVKRIRKLTDGLMLISDNPAYPPETVSGEDLAKLQIIGRVLWVGQTL
ncbi:XRE family transcriptional regulator [Caulobacter soli]|uniref:XRE family transcriptional regulator n=1 Tax=Caulobacter soli TaxID=2708539 RepID=UPI0013EA4E6F|nr:LexA family transcriptional regulator [Caulobacter soli]